MNAPILHSGFDGLRFTVQTDISPAFREQLAEAKAKAHKWHSNEVIYCGTIALAVRNSGGTAFSAHTGDDGAEWYFLDPQNRAANNPGVTVDFRAALLANGGLDAARRHFENCMEVFGIRYTEQQLRVSRIDFAIDILAPWFEPDRDCLTVPPGTQVTEYTDTDKSETRCTGSRVTGLRAGAVAGRQLAIYDKRAEVIKTGKMGWVEIWNKSLATLRMPPLDFTDWTQSRVWRFELRMGSKQLRNRWEIKNWFDLDAMVGDAFQGFAERMKYREPNGLINRSLWPEHELWLRVKETLAQDMRHLKSGVTPKDFKEANRAEHIRMLDTQILGLMVSRAAAGEISADDFEDFLLSVGQSLARASDEHPVSISVRLAKSAAKYRFR
jgi:hypothetical protein